jgi:hypothetical protein
MSLEIGCAQSNSARDLMYKNGLSLGIEGVVERLPGNLK